MRLARFLLQHCMFVAATATSFTISATKVAAANPASPVRTPIVVIDAGHGGFDRGGIPGQRVPEKAMALDVAQRLKLLLRADGYRVVMTRDTDVFVPLPGRVAIANSYRNAIFVCIHFNSSTRAGANGIETYYYRRDAAALAANIHRNVIAGAPSDNRGIRQRGYYVLRKTAIPAVLVECGFLTNPNEARLALSTTYRQKLADEIARGVLGKPPLAIREPASRRYPAATEVESQPFNSYVGTDFVRVPMEHFGSTHHHGSRSSRYSHHKKSTRKKSTSKKSSSSSKTGD